VAKHPQNQQKPPADIICTDKAWASIVMGETSDHQSGGFGAGGSEPTSAIDA